MKNPLVFFVGAAVVAVTVLAGATYDRWRDWPTAFETAAEDPGPVAEEDPVAAGEPEPDAATAGQTSPDAQPALRKLPEDAAEAPVEVPPGAPEIAEMEPAQPDEKPAEDTAEAPAAAPGEGPAEPERLAAVDPAEPEPPAPALAEAVAPDAGAEAPMRPSFDVVRFEEDGSLIAVGRAAPDAAMSLLLDGKAIATSQANEAGEWLIMPDDPLPPGDHEVTVEARDAGTGTTVGEAVALSVPPRTAIARSEPLPSPSPEADAAPQAEDQAAPHAEDQAATEPAEAPGGAEEGEKVALAPLPEAEAETEAEPETSIESRPPPEALEVPLSLETVDYNDDGDIVFSGRADPGRSVRIYVDNRFVGETTAALDGNWTFAGREQIVPGRHVLRTDLIDMTGKVSARLELPFMRADSRDIAALVEARREAAEEGAAAPEVEDASESEPEVQPEAPIAEQAAPEPEPETPAVAEQIAPEPETPEEVDQAAPETEPEAPAVAEQVAPEPEPETPAVAEQIAPEPEAPAVAEQVAPEPEPEEPAVAEQVAPAPEPEALAGAEQVAPEPEAPAVAEQIAPEPEPDAPQPATAEPVETSDAPVVAVLEEKPAPEPEVAPSGPGHVVIQPGNNLWRISRVIYGRGVRYTVIYQANRDQIRDPDLIYPGQIFTTPGVHPPKEIDPAWRQPLTPEDLARQEAAE